MSNDLKILRYGLWIMDTFLYRQKAHMKSFEQLKDMKPF